MAMKVYPSLRVANEKTHGYYTRELNRIFRPIGGWRILPESEDQYYLYVKIVAGTNSIFEVRSEPPGKKGWSKDLLSRIEKNVFRYIREEDIKHGKYPCFYDEKLIEEAKKLASSMGVELEVLNYMVLRDPEVIIRLRAPGGVIGQFKLSPDVIKEVNDTIIDFKTKEAEKANRPSSTTWTAADEFWAHVFSGSLRDFD